MTFEEAVKIALDELNNKVHAWSRAEINQAKEILQDFCDSGFFTPVVGEFVTGTFEGVSNEDLLTGINEIKVMLTDLANRIAQENKDHEALLTAIIPLQGIV
jgi:hypothetical protein